MDPSATPADISPKDTPMNKSPDDQRRARTATVGAFVGNALEWYDFFVFGTATALVFGRVFFPEFGPSAGLLASFATFWVGFLTRPLGGALFGHFGDRYGRKNVLVVTLVLMGSATALMGVLPTYGQVGILAPILLVALRALQGLAVGGEWGGAILIATENAPEKRKTLAGAWVQQGSPVGSILATTVFMLVGLLPDDDFYAWGWRVPFLLSLILIIVGLVLRLKVQESDEFTRTRVTESRVKVPVIAVLRGAPLVVLLAIAASVMSIALAYFSNTFLLAWTTGSLGIERQTMLNVLLGASVVQFFAQLGAAVLAERFGRLAVMQTGLLISLLIAAPFFLAIDDANVLFIAVTLYVTMAGVCAYFAVLATFLAYAFPPEVRYSGMSLSYQLCSSLIGGSTPFVAQWILNTTNNNTWGVAAFYCTMLIVTIAGVYGLHVVSTRSQRVESPVAQCAGEPLEGSFR
jgi:MFS family permease